jgi:bHLH factor
VPSGSDKKAKGVILSRVQYIHHLKENETRNIEKWTLDRKPLMDQAMGDLQVQLDEICRMWKEERGQRQRAEQERGKAPASGGEKHPASPEGGEEGDGKRQRTELFSFRSCFCTISAHSSCRWINPIPCPKWPSFCDQRV